MHWECANLLFGCADSRFAEPRISFWEGFNFVSAKPPLRRAESRFAKPRCSLQRERIVTFCVVQKVTKKHAGLRPATSIQIAGRYEIFAEMSGVHQVTGYAESCIFPSIAGNDLNRCDVPALQRKELERTAKEQLYSLQTVGYGWVGMGDGGWKRVAWMAIRKGLFK